MGPRRRRQPARPLTGLSRDRRPKKKAAAIVPAIGGGDKEVLTKASKNKDNTQPAIGRYHFAVFERGRFVGILSAKSRSAARAILAEEGLAT